MLRLLWRSIREPEYRTGFGERFGLYQSVHAGQVIWVHAVSAGETIAAVPLIERLLDDGHQCLVTNMTPTGRDRVRALLGERVENCYAPYDLPGSLARFLKEVRPQALLLVDTELWPNMIHACAQKGVPIMVVNGRLSARSAKGYERIGGLAKPMMKLVDHYAVQTGSHAERFKALGVQSDKIEVAGSIKFDSQPRELSKAVLEHARATAAGRPVIMGASTHQGEESALLEAWQTLRRRFPALMLVLAPRHIHRLAEVLSQCAERGIQAVCLGELDDEAGGGKPDVLVIDQMGVLDAWYPVATLAFIGGSLVPVGGHNLLEAVRVDTAVVMGTHLDNIDDIAGQFIDAQAMQVVNDETELTESLAELLGDEEKRRRMVSAATNVYRVNQGALDRVQASFRSLLADG